MSSGFTVPEALAVLCSRDSESWSLLAGHHELDDVRVRLNRVARAHVLPSALSVDVPADRLPVIVAHGPGLHAAIATFAAARNRYWIVAPFRSALVLLESGVCPDIVVLAERDTTPVDDSLSRWQALPSAAANLLRGSTLVVDAFAPPELVGEFARAFRFDSGLGADAQLPFCGLGVVAAVSLAASLGHRAISLAGISLQGVVAEHVTILAAAGVEFVELANGAKSRRVRASQPPSADQRSSVAKARERCEWELRALQDRFDRLRQAQAGPVESAALLLDEVREEWQNDRAVRAATLRFGSAWTRSLWALGKSGQPLDARLSLRALCDLVFPELEAAIAQHHADCSGCFEQTLGISTVAR